MLNFTTWTMWVAYRGRESLAAFSNPQDQTMMVIICRVSGVWHHDPAKRSFLQHQVHLLFIFLKTLEHHVHH